MLHGPLKALLFVSRCQRDLWASSTTLAWFQLLLISWELCWIWTHTWMHFPLIYRNSATSWVNAEIFFSQFHKNFMPHVISKLTEMQLEPKALLLLDNCSAHPEAIENGRHRNGHTIENVDRFAYLGAYVSNEGGTTQDVSNRVSKARGSFIKLKNSWSSSKITRNTKVKLYKSLL